MDASCVRLLGESSPRRLWRLPEKNPRGPCAAFSQKYGPAPSAEEIDQNRAMFANFPRSDF